MTARGHTPKLADLIEEMWNKDFRRRPAFSAIIPRLTECKSMNGFALTADEQFALPLAALKHFLGSSGQLAFSNDATHTCHSCVFIVIATSSATAY